MCGFPHCTGNLANTARCQGDLLILHADFAQACFYLFKLESEGLERFFSVAKALAAFSEDPNVISSIYIGSHNH